MASFHQLGSVRRGPDLSGVRALVCVPSPLLRQGVRMALNNLGIRAIEEASGLEAAHRKLSETETDLLIMDAEIEGADTTILLQDVRTGTLGRDPFVVAAVLLNNPSDTLVRRAVDSGADDIILVPFAADQMMARLTALVSRRKPFVVTHDYIGPDRRTRPRPGEATAAQFHVPNPLAARAGGASPERYAAIRKQMFDAVTNERIKRLAAHTEWECRAIRVRLNEGKPNPEAVSASLYRLETVCDELACRIDRHLGHATDQVSEILCRCKSFRSAPDALTLGDVEHLLTASRRLSGVYAGR